MYKDEIKIQGGNFMNFYKQFQQELKQNPMPRTRYMDHIRQRGQVVSVRMSVEEREQFEKLYKESDRKSTRLNSSHSRASRMPSSA